MPGVCDQGLASSDRRCPDFIHRAPLVVTLHSASCWYLRSCVVSLGKYVNVPWCTSDKEMLGFSKPVVMLLRASQKLPTPRMGGSDSCLQGHFMDLRKCWSPCLVVGLTIKIEVTLLCSPAVLGWRIFSVCHKIQKPRYNFWLGT